jgi:16S rRNA G527 N7-methylase RsmG
VLHERGEKLCRKAEYEHSFDWAVVRAVGPADEMLRICLPFLRTGGTAILFKALLKGDELRLLEEEALCQRASLELLPVHVPFLDAPRTLVLATRCST